MRRQERKVQRIFFSRMVNLDVPEQQRVESLLVKMKGMMMRLEKEQK